MSAESTAARARLTITELLTPPEWALQERALMERLEDAAREFVARYTRDDGTLIWREEWPGMDGSDDPYEAFMYLALFYSVGGSEEIYDMARKLWDSITWQWTQYGQIDREFDRYYDWMHHGEANLFHYFFGLTRPDSVVERQRARRFAGMYDGSDPIADNYDPELHLIRAPQAGSAGPRLVVTEEDLSTHRGVLDDYPAPFEDMVTSPYSLGTCNWSDDAVFAEVIELMNQRTTRGDVPLNLNATGQFTHAYLYSGEEDLKTWVLEYLATWQARADDNDGLLPDNVGLSGVVGEYNDGKWWGGHYGWRWPHGWLTIIEPTLNASLNAYLLTRGNEQAVRLVRQQIDTHFALGHSEGEGWLVPHKRLDSGWSDYRPANPFHAIHLWARTMADDDRDRVERVPRTTDWAEVVVPRRPFSTKHFNANTLAWYEYSQGRNPDYPDRLLAANNELIDQQLRRMRSSEGDPRTWDAVTHIDGYTDTVSMQTDGYAIHAWQEFCPVYFESLIQLMWGAPMHISHGGLQHATVRYYDGDAQRPGLPPGVAALVNEVSSKSTTIELVNTDSGHGRTVVIQAGTFGEHRFTTAEIRHADGSASEALSVDSEWLDVHLAPGAGATLVIGMDRYANDPSYQTPWSRRESWDPVIRPRQQ